MLKKGATNYNEAIEEAEKGGYIEIVKLIKSYRDM